MRKMKVVPGGKEASLRELRPAVGRLGAVIVVMGLLCAPAGATTGFAGLITTDKQEYIVGEAISITYTVLNVLTHSSHGLLLQMEPAMNVFVENDHVRLWSAFETEICELGCVLALPPLGAERIVLTWNGTDDAGNAVDPGTYQLVGWPVDAATTVTIVPEPCTLLLLGPGLAVALGFRERKGFE